MPLSLYIGVRIKAFRKALKLNQQALADKVGCEKMAISRYERGAGAPNAEYLTKLAIALRVSPAELLPPTLLSVSREFLPRLRDEAIEKILSIDSTDKLKAVIRLVDRVLLEQAKEDDKLIDNKDNLMQPDLEPLEAWIRNLGQTYEYLIENRLIPFMPLKALYEDANSLELEPLAGIELVFSSSSKRFESIYTRLSSNETDKAPLYTGDLPRPFRSNMGKSDIRAQLGEPYKSYDRTNLHEEYGLGGWDFYYIEFYSKTTMRVEFQYDLDFNLTVFIISVLDKDS